jgi:hypothetical protein
MAMNQYDSVLKTYADSGLRSVQDWISLGREITSGAQSRVAAMHRGESISLFSRDQTQSRPRSRNARTGPPAPAKMP